MNTNGKPASHQAQVLAALEQFEARLTRYAMRMLGDKDSARDAVQHTFLRLCDEDLRGLEGKLAPWLFTVCRNKSIDLLRRRETTPANSEVADEPAGQEKNPSLQLEQEDLHAGLRRLVEALPSRQREAVEFWLEGFTYQEIADITGRGEGSIRVGVHRALHQIRSHPWTRKFFEDP